MIASCDYDGVDVIVGGVFDISKSDCSYYCIFENGCDASLLANGTCDDCNHYLACNSWECGFDGGDCGYCAQYCFEDDLGSGACTNACNNQECYY